MSFHAIRRDAFALILPLLLIGLATSVRASDAHARDLLPSEKALAGWSLDGEPRSFSADSLWKYINGAAEQYLSFGCTSLTVAYYVKDQGEITIEIYRMADPLGAFGIYQLERPCKEAYLTLGAEGYQDDDRLGFFGDLYYVKLQAYPAEPSELEAMRRIGTSLAQGHLAGSTFPKELDLLPDKDRVQDSFQYIPAGALGLGGLSRVITARYSRTVEEFTLYLVREQEPEEAEIVFSSVRASLEKRSTAPSAPLTVESAQGVQIEHRYQGTVWVLRSGADLVLIAGVLDGVWTRSVTRSLLENLATHRQ